MLPVQGDRNARQFAPMAQSNRKPAHPAVAVWQPGSPDFVMLGAPSASGTLEAQARLLGTMIDTRELANNAAASRAAASTGVTLVFRYGVAVTLAPDVSPTSSLDAALQAHIIDPMAEPEREAETISIVPGADDRVTADGQIILADASEERLLLVATMLARSVVLSRDEILVSEAFDRIDPLVLELRERGRVRLPTSEVMQLVGNVLAAKHRVMGTVQVDERPELLWDHPELDRLYVRLEAEYELNERAEVLERKFGALGDCAEVLLDIVQDKRSFRLEAAIIALIAFEIMLTLFDMAGR